MANIKKLESNSEKRPHFPIPSINPSETLGETRRTGRTADFLKGRNLPPPVDGQYALCSIFSSSMFRNGCAMDSTAIIEQGRLGLTFRQLDEMARRIARIIGIKISLICPNEKESPTNSDGDSVVLIVTSDLSIDEKMLVYILAILKLGGTVLTACITLMDETRYAKMIKQVRPLIVINIEDTVSPIVSRHTVLSSVQRNGKAQAYLPNQIWTATNLWMEAVEDIPNVRDDLSVSPLRTRTAMGDRTIGIFPCNHETTSGSDGRPAWIRMGNKAIYNRIQWEKIEFPLYEQERCYLSYPLSDPRSFVQIFLPLTSGRCLTLLDPTLVLSPTRLLFEIQLSKLVRIHLSPTQLDDFLSHVDLTGSQSSLLSTRIWMISGGLFSLSLGEKFFSIVPSQSRTQLIVFYGCDEVLWSATWVCYSNAEELQQLSFNENVCLGQPVHNTNVHIIDDKDWEDCPLGVKGEVCLAGQSVASGGYSGQLRKAKPGVMFQTGDLGRIIQTDEKTGCSRMLVVEGKAQTRVKLHGKTIDLHEMARFIENEYPNSIRKCVLFVAPRTKDYQIIVGGYIPVVDENQNDNDSFEDIKTRLSSMHHLVQTYIRIKEIPILFDDKVDYKALRKEFHNYLTSPPDEFFWNNLASQTSSDNIPTAKILCRAVASSLGIQINSVVEKFKETFWKLGGSPTKLVRTVVAVRAQNYLLEPEDFLAAEKLYTLVDRMVIAKRKYKTWEKSVRELGSGFRYETLQAKHRRDMMRMLKTDYVIKTPRQPVFLERFWRQVLDEIIPAEMSLVAQVKDKIVGLTLNCKFSPKVKGVPNEMFEVLNFLQGVVDASRTEVNALTVGKLAKCFYIAVDENVLSPAQQVVVIRDLLDRSFNLIERCGCGSYLICTANPLVQEVASCLLKYRVICEFPLNRYKTKEFHKPFWDKDDHLLIGLYLKVSTNTNPVKQDLPVEKSDSSSYSNPFDSNVELKRIVDSTPTANQSSSKRSDMS